MKRPSLRVTIPARLLPYLEDMLRGGFYGITLRAAAVEAVQREIRREVERGAIPLRIHGKAVTTTADDEGLITAIETAIDEAGGKGSVRTLAEAAAKAVALRVRRPR